jgi:hypothetical protein
MLDPERMRASNATKLERRLLSAGGGELPSPELTNRMRQAVGLSAAGTAGASATALAATKSAGLAWISAGIIAAAIVGGATGVWTSYRRTVAARTPAPAATECAVSPSAETAPSAAVAAPLAARPDRPRSHLAVVASAASSRGDLRDEIALVDEARTALREQAPRRALALLHRYVAAYPSGTFGPEAEALRVQALDDSGQHRLAQSLAREFVSRHPGSPLAERVRRSIDDRL